jgi:hypothetical protein
MGNSDLKKKIVQWGQEQLTTLGYTLKNIHPEKVLDTPWSYLVRFETSDGYVYLKHTPEMFSLEPTIIKILDEQFNASVPEVISHNTGLNCFLMKNAGRTLREILKQKFDEDLLSRTIDQFTSLQVDIADQVGVFLDVGVPDYRLDKLTDLYRTFISQKELLIEEGLSDAEVNKLESLTTTVSSLCEELSGYHIKQTIVQPDFNDNNTLVDDMKQKLTIIDLGEIVISHPFFSLLNFLQQIKKHHGLTDGDDVFLRLKDACFKNHRVYFDPKEDFQDMLATAELVNTVYGLVYQVRFMRACGKENLVSYQHWKLGNLLRNFIAIFTDTH